MKNTTQTYKKNYFHTALILWGFWAIVIVLSPHLFAQTKPSTSTSNKPDKSKEQPLELPEFIITGVESIDVPGGTKQAPSRSVRLTQDELDRFNPLEKQSPRFQSAAAPQARMLERQQYQGFVRGEFGIFLTPALEAGYHATAGDFDLYGRVHGVYSQGHLPNAGFTDFGGSLTASYIAAEKFFFFGGSKTDSYILLRSRSYQGFAVSPAPSFTTLEFGGGVATKGTFEVLQYDMGASFEQMNANYVERRALNDVSSFGTNQLFKGHLGAATNLGAIQLGGRINLELQGQQFSDGRTLAPYFIQAVATVEYRSKPAFTSVAGEGMAGFIVLAELGGQAVSGTEGNAAQAITAKVKAELNASPVLTIRAGAETGFQPLALRDLMRQNPYFAMLSPVPFPRTLYDVHAQVVLHPSPALTASVGGRLRSVNDMPVFGSLLTSSAERSGLFGVGLVEATILSGEAEVLWNISSADALTLHGIYNSTIQVSGIPFPLQFTATVPYLAPIQASASYRRQWSEAFSTKLGLTYMGERPYLHYSAGMLPAFIDLMLGAEYAFSSRFSVFVRGENLLNQRIFIWESYQERGIFAAAGVVWKF